MPSCASSADLSNGDDANSVEVGDIKPKSSAGSASAEGFRGNIWNSVDLGDIIGSVGVTDPSSLLGKVGTVIVFSLTSDRSGSMILSDGTTWPAGSTYVGDALTELMALGLWLCSELSLGHGIPEGAEDGPGLRAGSESSSGTDLWEPAALRDRAAE